jgi:PAS domain S-box-containing protein
MNQFERIARGIKNGDKELGIRPLKYEKGLVILEKFFNEWNTTLKPMLLEMTEASEDKARILLDKYELRIHSYVSEIDGFVSLLENDYKKSIKDFDKFRLYTLGFFFIATVFIIFYARSSFIKPVHKLRDAAKEIEKGNLDVRVDIKGEDDIGLLGMAFNSMVLTRKQEEDQLRKLSIAVEQSPNTVVITDIQGNIEYVNPKFTEVTGYTHEEVIGNNPRILKSGNTHSAVYKELWETITSGGQWQGELVNRKKNGDLYHASVTISPIRDKEGNITHFLSEEVDITERKETEETIRKKDEHFRSAIENIFKFMPEGVVVFTDKLNLFKQNTIF